MKNTVQNFDDEFKIIIVGTSGVGKSAILIRFADDKFDDDMLRPTIGVDFRFKTLDIDGKKIKVQIWDTAGQEGFRTIVSAYYKGADAIIVVFDNSDNHSFTDI
jgi:Ras-related protein Rab-1A